MCNEVARRNFQVCLIGDTASTQRRNETAITAKPQHNAAYKAATSLYTPRYSVLTQITHLSDAVEENREQIRNVTEVQCITAERIQTLEYEIEKLESFSRRNNLRFFNVSQPTNEIDDDWTRTLVRTFKQFYPSKRWNEDDIVRAYRTDSAASNGQRQLPIIASF